jgi:fructose-specific phosphotransferase system IIC component
MDQLKSGVSKALPVLVGGSAFIAPSISNALTKEDLSSLSYLQVRRPAILAFSPSLPPSLFPSGDS